MKHLKASTFAFCFLIMGLGHAQTWSNIWTGGAQSEAHAIVQTPDTSFILAGSSGGKEEGLMLLKIDGEGNPVWEKKFPDSIYHSGNHLASLADGNYIVVGSGTAGKENIHNWVLKFDVDGNIIWEKIYDNIPAPFDINAGVKPTPDSGFVICKNDLIKFDKYGNIEWQKNYGVDKKNILTGVVLADDGGYVVTGWSESYFPDHIISFLIKTDNKGNEKWIAFPKNKYLVTPSFGYDVVVLDDGYIVLGVGINHKNAGLILWKTDLEGNIQWCQNHKGTMAIKLLTLSDSGFACSGMDADGFLFMTTTDEQGLEKQRYIFPKKENRYVVAHDILAVHNKLFLLLGTEYGEGSSSAFLAKIFFN